MLFRSQAAQQRDAAVLRFVLSQDGWVYPGDTVPEFEKAMNDLKIGEVSEPIQTQFGWHLIEAVGDLIPGSTRPLDSALKAQIRAQLETRQKQAKLQAWFTTTQTQLDSQIEYAPGFGSASG